MAHLLRWYVCNGIASEWDRAVLSTSDGPVLWPMNGARRLRLEDVGHKHDDGRLSLILRPMCRLLTLRPRITLRMLLRRAALSVFGRRPLYNVGDRRAVLVRVQSDGAARLDVEYPQPKLPPLHSLDLV